MLYGGKCKRITVSDESLQILKQFEELELKPRRRMQGIAAG